MGQQQDEVRALSRDETPAGWNAACGRAEMAGVVGTGAGCDAAAGGTATATLAELFAETFIGVLAGTVVVRRVAASAQRMGDGRGFRFIRCALPTTAFFVIPNRLPISAVEWPSLHKAPRRVIISSFQSMQVPPVDAAMPKRNAFHNGAIPHKHKNLWTTCPRQQSLASSFQDRCLG